MFVPADVFDTPDFPSGAKARENNGNLVLCLPDRQTNHQTEEEPDLGERQRSKMDTQMGVYWVVQTKLW